MVDETKGPGTLDDSALTPTPMDVCDGCEDSRAYIERWGYSCIQGSAHSWRRPNSDQNLTKAALNTGCPTAFYLERLAEDLAGAAVRGSWPRVDEVRERLERAAKSVKKRDDRSMDCTTAVLAEIDGLIRHYREGLADSVGDNVFKWSGKLTAAEDIREVVSRTMMVQKRSEG